MNFFSNQTFITPNEETTQQREQKIKREPEHNFQLKIKRNHLQMENVAHLR